MNYFALPRTVFVFTICMSYAVDLSMQHTGRFEVDPDQDPVNSLRSSDFIRDKEHLREHIRDMKFDPDEASPEELDFHFFNLHDIDQDDRLDGLELLSALLHHVLSSRHTREEQGDSMLKPNPRYDRVMLRQCIAIVDKTLKDDDADGDGYIDYAEFAHTRRASELLQQINTRPDKQVPI